MAQRNINPIFYDADENGKDTSVQNASSVCEAGHGRPMEVKQFRKRGDLPPENSYQGGPDAEQSVAEIVKNIEERGGRAVVDVWDTASAAYEKGKARAGETYQDLKQTSAAWIGGARAKGRRIKDDHPLQLLAILGGTSCMIGALLRVWRSSRHE